MTTNIKSAFFAGLALCAFVVLVLPGSAHAQMEFDDWREVLNPTDGDPCPNMTAEECFWGSESSNNGGTAGGMAACTAYKYCTSCELTLNGNSSVCIKAFRNANCKCSYETYNGQTYCSSSGDCTYKGA